MRNPPSLLIAFCGALPFLASSAPATAQALAFSEQKLARQVAGGEAVSARVYLQAGDQEVTGVKLLPSDLASEDGKHVAATDFTVEPATIEKIAAASAEMLTLSVSKFPASGTYRGKVGVIHAGHDPEKPVELAIELTVTAASDLELPAGFSKIVIEATRAVVPWSKPKAAATFSLKQKADVPAEIAAFSVIDAATSEAGALRLPAAAIEAPGDPPRIAAGSWQTLTRPVDVSRLDAGHYAARIAVSTTDGAEEIVDLEVRVRDAWPLPLLVLLVGVFFSFVISFMTTVGAGRLKALRHIDALRARIAAAGGFPAERITEWKERLDDLEQDAAKLAPADVQPKIDEVEKAIDEAEKVAGEWRGRLAGWRRETRDWGLRAEISGDAHSQALASSPMVAGLRRAIGALEEKIDRGGFSAGDTASEMQYLEVDVTTAGRLFAVLPTLAQIELEDAQEQKKIRALAAAIQPADLGAAEDLKKPPLRALVRGLKEAGVIEIEEPEIPHYGTLAEEEEAVRGWIAGAVDWLKDPRNYLRLFSMLLGLLFLVLLLAAGMQALYAGKPTFGADRFADYLGLLLWGIGAEASRGKLHDLESAAGFLSRRLGLKSGAADK